MEDTKLLNAARQHIHEGRITEGIELCLRLTELGSAEAPDYLGVLYRSGTGVQKDKKRAAQYFLMAHNRGYPMGTYHLAGEYQRESKPQEALELYKSIAEINPSAAYWAFRSLEHGVSDNEESSIEADKYLNLAAKMGHVQANKTIAFRMIKGKRGISKIPCGVYLLSRTIVLGMRSVARGERFKYIDSLGPSRESL
jgi:TPR repeat protein